MNVGDEQAVGGRFLVAPLQLASPLPLPLVSPVQGVPLLQGSLQLQVVFPDQLQVGQVVVVVRDVRALLVTIQLLVTKLLVTVQLLAVVAAVLVHVLQRPLHHGGVLLRGLPLLEV